MGSFASLLALLLATGATDPASAGAAPPAFAGAVTDCLAREWRVPASRIRLAWGRLPGHPREGAGPPFVDGAPVRVAGIAADGWSVVLVGSRAPLVAVRVRAGVEDSVPVAARALVAGAVLGPGDVESAPRVHWGPPSCDEDTRPAAGWVVRRPLEAGAELTSRMAVPPPLVIAGEPVELTWSQGGVQIVLAGVALNSARAGEVVRARVPGRSGAVAGTAVAAGRAALGRGASR